MCVYVYTRAHTHSHIYIHFNIYYKIWKHELQAKLGSLLNKIQQNVINDLIILFLNYKCLKTHIL